MPKFNQISRSQQEALDLARTLQGKLSANTLLYPNGGSLDLIMRGVAMVLEGRGNDSAGYVRDKMSTGINALFSELGINARIG